MSRNARRRYEILALLAVLWCGSVAFRGLGNPRAENLVLHKTDRGYYVACDLKNPGRRTVHVAASIRLINRGSPEDGRPLTASPKYVVRCAIPPKSTVRIEQPLKVIGQWSEAEVQVSLDDDPPLLEAAWQGWLNSRLR